jgi:hypothetical protein
LQERAFYCDTGSIIYVKKESEPPLIETGDHLDDMTNELKTAEFIEEFVSGGPKNYAYRVCKRDASQMPKTVCKVCGITLNYTPSQLFNFIVIREMILKGEPATVNVHTYKKIKRNRRTEGGDACVSLVTEAEDKIYRLLFLKRCCLNDNTPFPFGCK